MGTGSRHRALVALLALAIPGTGATENALSLREGLVAYYRGSQRLASSLQGLPAINHTVGSLTGYLPIEFSTFGAELTAGDRTTLLEALRSDPELVGNIRLLHSELIFLDREFERLMAQGQHLLTMLD